MDAFKFEELIRARDLALVYYDGIHKSADEAGMDAMRNAEWRNRNYNDILAEPSEWEDPAQAYRDTYDAEFGLEGLRADDDLTTANIAVEAAFVRLYGERKEEPSADPSTLLKLLNVPLPLDE